jgi:O-antigen ligase
MKGLSYENSYRIYLGVFSFLFFCVPNLTSLGVILFIPLVLTGIFRKELRFHFESPQVLLISVYILYLIGIFFTENMYLASRYAENKLSFLIFPLLFLFRPTFALSHASLLIGSALGIIVASISGIISAYSCFAQGGDLRTCFTSVYISTLHHPTYFATFVALVVFGVWDAFLRKAPFFKVSWILPFSLFALVMFTLCLSLSAFLFVAMLVAAIVLRWIRNRYGKKVFRAFLLLTPVIISLFLVLMPGLRNDVRYTYSTVQKYMQDPKGFLSGKTGYKTGNEVRLVMWTVTSEEIAKHPLGVGTGNVDAHLSHRLKEYGQLDLAKQDDHGAIQYNPHNQFLQTGLEIGLFGLFVLLLFMSQTWRLARNYKNYLLMAVVASLVVNSLFESMLQRQSGIVFYAFWMCLLTLISVTNTKNQAQEE